VCTDIVLIVIVEPFIPKVHIHTSIVSQNTGELEIVKDFNRWLGKVSPLFKYTIVIRNYRVSYGKCGTVVHIHTSIVESKSTTAEF